MEIGLRLVGAVLIILDWLLLPVFWWKSRKRGSIIPPVKDPLLENSAVYLADRIRKKVISSEEVIQAYIKRIKEVDPLLNAVVEDRFDAALEDAKRVDKYISEYSLTEKQLKIEKPLLGVPVTIKESCGLAGLSQCVGSLSRLGIKADSDGEAVARLKNAGAIPLLVSNTPELCLDWECNNLVTGPTSNPYNTNCTSGGSSGGEGALLGAAGSVIGLGSDIAGSIRVPAMFNGVFGHKPTPGLIPIGGHIPFCYDDKFPEYLVVGPMARYAEDLKLMMKVLAGNAADKIRLDEQVDLSTITVYCMNESGYSLVILPVQQEIKILIEKAILHLKEACCCKISDFKFKEMGDSPEISIALFFAIKDIPNVLEESDNSKVKHNLYIELIKCIFGLSKFFKDTLLFYILQKTNLFIPKKNFENHVANCKILKEKIMSTLGTTGIFLYPTFPISAFLHSTLPTKSSGVIYTMIFNVLGFPSTHVPLGFDQKGMPIGFQVVASPNQDRLCLAVAMELQKSFGGWRKPS